MAQRCDRVTNDAEQLAEMQQDGRQTLGPLAEGFPQNQVPVTTRAQVATSPREFPVVARIIEAAKSLDWRHRISDLATATKEGP
jgi:hypothetical protein